MLDFEQKFFMNSQIVHFYSCIFCNFQEILKQIKVKNLDTGQEMNLEDAETHLPDSINPLSLHIMRLTSGEFEIENQQKIREIYFL